MLVLVTTAVFVFLVGPLGVVFIRSVIDLCVAGTNRITRPNPAGILGKTEIHGEKRLKRKTR
jgi:hypothetical protein